MDASEFEWESQLRFYWEQKPDDLIVRQCTGHFGYGYEYMGLNGRLVITPLTDRIYLTITQVCSFCSYYLYKYGKCESIFLMDVYKEAQGCTIKLIVCLDVQRKKIK